MSIFNLNEFIFAKFFHDQRWIITELSLAIDGPSKTVMTIDDLQWRLSTGSQLSMICDSPQFDSVQVIHISYNLILMNL